jgi:hypothetical protein
MNETTSTPRRGNRCYRTELCGVCFRKPSLIAFLIPSSIKVFATSGTLVPWVPSLDS